jgi:hypothetical protein
VRSEASWRTGLGQVRSAASARRGTLARFSEFLGGLKRRRVIRARLGRGIFSSAVLQIHEPVMHGLHLPG